MSTVTTAIKPLIRNYRRGNLNYRRKTSVVLKPNGLSFGAKPVSNGGSFFCKFKCRIIKASSSTETPVVDTSESSEVFFEETFPLKRTQKLEGNFFVRLDQVKGGENWQLSVGCSLPGKWILHWGVSYLEDVGSEWDQPPEEMRPPGSIPIKDYAIETPLKKSSEADTFHQVKIDIDSKSAIAAINFVMKDEETGVWYQHKGRDFRVPLVDSLQDVGNVIGKKNAFGLWSGCTNQYI